MNRKIILGAALAALVAGSSLAIAQDRPGMKGPMTRAQVQAMVQERFARVDANHDGVVTKAEFDAYVASMKAERTAKRGKHRDERFAELDTNKDGQISKAEFDAQHGPDDAARGGMGRHRMNRHGHAGGMSMRGWGGNPDAMFAAMDANKDGRVTLAEAMAKPLAMFDRADADHDGTVTPEERRAAWVDMTATHRAN